MSPRSGSRDRPGTELEGRARKSDQKGAPPGGVGGSRVSTAQGSGGPAGTQSRAEARTGQGGPVSGLWGREARLPQKKV